MQGNHLFEYAIVRIVPRVEREEFLNIGVIVYCASEKFLKAALTLDDPRLEIFRGLFDEAEVRHHLDSFNKICLGGQEGGAIGMLDIASRFRWLTATRSTVIQTSRVHPGFCDNADEALSRLFSQMVG